MKRIVQPMMQAALATLLMAGTASAQGPSGGGFSLQPNPFTSGVRQGEATSEELPLTLNDAIQRGLKSNLGAISADLQRSQSLAGRDAARAEFLPTFGLGVRGSQQQINLAALGFSGFPGIPQIIGPFGIFDLRGYLSQSVLNVSNIRRYQAAGQGVKAAEQGLQNSRDLVALAAGGLYLQSVAGESRVESARAQVRTAEALYNQAMDFKKSGLIPAIDVLRAQVELEAERQRLVAAESDFAKMKLALAQAIGLPLTQRYKLVDKLSDEALPPVSVEQAIEKAYEFRGDYRAAQALVAAAEFARRSASAARYPTVAVNADYGTTGQSIVQNHGTFTAGIGVTIPVFTGGRVQAGVDEAATELKQRTADRDALRARIEDEIRSVFLDLQSTLDQTKLARNALTLAETQVAQARDRFAAGVATSLELVQAQQAEATASDNYIGSLFGYNLAKGTLAKSAGQAEKLFSVFVLGEKK